MEDEPRYDGDAGERPKSHRRIFRSHFLDLTVFNDYHKSSIYHNIRFLIHVEATRMEKKRMRRKLFTQPSENGNESHETVFICLLTSSQEGLSFSTLDHYAF